MMSAREGISKEITVKADLPRTTDIGATGRNAYIINNAVGFIYPQKKKITDPRFGFLNLSGEESRNAQFCPVTSIADSQPQCSIGKTTLKETEERSLNYSMEMGLEVETLDKAIWSYYVNMEKVNSDRKDYEFFISGTLNLPTNSFTVGEKLDKKDLKDGPLSAVTTFYEMLYSINTITKKAYKRTALKGKLKPRIILRDFFDKIMVDLLKCSIKKSIGDYGQEFTAAAKFGTLDNAGDYNTHNINGDANTISIPYNVQGNALRIMVANDRPSAYRAIAFALFTDPESINTRTITGYYYENYEKAMKKKEDAEKESKKTGKKKCVPLPKNILISGINAYVPGNPSQINFDPAQEDAALVSDKPILDKHYNNSDSIGKIRKSSRIEIRRSNRDKLSRRIKNNKQFAKWVKYESGGSLMSTKTLKGKKNNQTLFDEWTKYRFGGFKGGRKKRKRTRKKRRKKRNKTKNRREKRRKTKKRKRRKRRTKKNKTFIQSAKHKKNLK